MNSNQTDQLRDTLRRELHDIHPVGLGVETVQRRGRRRRNRGRAVVSVGAVACVAGLGVTVIERGAAPRSVAIGAPSTNTAVVTPPLAFRTVTGTVSYSTTHFTDAAGVTYELSTAPGVASPSAQPGQAIYSTSDGEHWTTADQSQAWISDLSERDGVLYAIGTAPGAANAADVTYRVGTSHDGGNAWSDTDLPFDLSIPHANVTLTRSSFVHIASTPTATVAVLSEDFSPDLTALTAARAPGYTDLSTRMTSAGYDLVDESGCAAASAAAEQRLAATPGSSAAREKVGLAAKCTDGPVVGTITWSDLGLSGPGDLSREEMLITTDGTHWTSEPAPTASDVANLTATSDGFVLLAQSNDPTLGVPAPDGTTTVLHSTDGRTWAQAGTPAGVNLQSVAGDSIIGYDASGALRTSTDGGSTWNTTTVSSLLPAGSPTPLVSGTDAGPLGFAVLVTASPTPNDQTANHDYLLFSVDGVDWTATNLAAVGAPAGAYPSQVTVGADHIGVDYESYGATPGGPATITTLLATPKR